jgi:hypothetical protein
MPPFFDLHSIEEDKRIELIGNTAYCDEHGGFPSIAFVVDLEGPDGFEKADRYIVKLLAKFPEIEVQLKERGPTAGAVTVKIQRRKRMV